MTGTSSTRGRGSGSSSSNGSSSSYSESTAVVPWYEFHEFKELSSRNFRSLEEQLFIKKAQLKGQPNQHAAVFIPGNPVQLIKTSTIRDLPVNDRGRPNSSKPACRQRAGIKRRNRPNSKSFSLKINCSPKPKPLSYGLQKKKQAKIPIQNAQNSAPRSCARLDCRRPQNS